MARARRIRGRDVSEAAEADLDVFVARLEQLAPEGPDRRRDFIRRLTEASEPKAPEPEELPTNPEGGAC